MVIERNDRTKIFRFHSLFIRFAIIYSHLLNYFIVLSVVVDVDVVGGFHTSYIRLHTFTQLYRVRCTVPVSSDERFSDFRVCCRLLFSDGHLLNAIDGDRMPLSQ